MLQQPLAFLQPQALLEQGEPCLALHLYKLNCSYSNQRMFVYLELDSVDCVKELAEKLKQEFGADEIQVTPARSGNTVHVGMEALVRISAKSSPDKKVGKLQALPHVVFALQIS